MDAPGSPIYPSVYEYRFPIRLQHIDAAGIVFFARYFELAHEAYESFLEDLGHGIAAAIEKGDIIIPIASAEARYTKPMRHGERITAQLRLLKLRGSSFVVRTELSGPAGAGKDSRAVIVTGHVCVNRTTLRPVAIPDGLRVALAAYLHPE
jgi:1,4-dihydroxy-2-naphthoyl-CoA hydrolase